MPMLCSVLPGFFQEMEKTVWPWLTRYWIMEFSGERSRM